LPLVVSLPLEDSDQRFGPYRSPSVPVKRSGRLRPQGQFWASPLPTPMGDVEGRSVPGPGPWSFSAYPRASGSPRRSHSSESLVPHPDISLGAPVILRHLPERKSEGCPILLLRLPETRPHPTCTLRAKVKRTGVLSPLYCGTLVSRNLRSVRSFRTRSSCRNK
jgi:hypothetical protein